MDETEVGRIASWVGLDVGNADHHATVVSAAGEPLFERSVANDEAAIEGTDDRALYAHRARHSLASSRQRAPARRQHGEARWGGIGARLEPAQPNRA